MHCVSDDNNIFKFKTHATGIVGYTRTKGLYYFTEVDFGGVHCGDNLTKTVYIKNDTGENQTYFMEKKPTVNFDRYIFDCIINDKKIIERNETFEVKATYRPLVPGERSYERIQISDKSENKHVIFVKGASIGPRVTPSVKSLYFCVFKNTNIRKRTFEIRNNSTMDTMYHFDLDSDVFKINRKKGTIQAEQRFFVAIEFHPKSEGIYSEHLWCICLNQQPFLIELGGIHHPKVEYTPALSCQTYPIPLRLKTGNDGYFQSKFLQRDNILPVTLRTSHLFFDDENIHSCVMTNHTEDEVKIVWSEDLQDIFKITPQTITMPPNMSLTFNCRFNPPRINEIFTQTLTCQVYWTIDDAGDKRLSIISNPFKPLGRFKIDKVTPMTFYLPLPVSLKCAGHSLEKNCRWIAMVSVIPTTIILPPCVGSTNSYTNFLMESNGRFPVLFNILPPKKSHVVMKPMTGVIGSRSFQIITAQFNPPSTEVFYDEEIWHISLNGQTDRAVTFIVKCQCDVPSILVGNNNKIEFPCVQVGWKECLLVLLRNTSLFQLKYTFNLKGNDYLELEEMEGYIGASQEYYMKLYYKSSLCAPEESDIICKCQAVQDGFLVGKSIETKVKVFTTCAVSQLCALPKEIDFGEVEWNSSLQTHFTVYNFGNAPNNFQLSTGNTEETIELTPNEGTVNSEEKLLISVKLAAKKKGKHSINITSRVLNTEEVPGNLFTINLFCTYSKIQIEEIVDHNFGHLFSKSTLWKLFKVDTINRSLREIKNNEKISITCFLPDCEVGDQVYFIRFLISNSSKFDTDVTLKRVKLCDCERSETKSLSFRKKIYSCPHRELFKMDISNSTLKANSRSTLKLEMKYSVSDQNKLCYLIELSHKRTIEITTIIKSISDEVSTLSVYRPECVLDLGEIFIGTRNPPLRSFWLYNNSSQSVTYHVDDAGLIKFSTDEDFPILNCYNAVDIVNAHESCPLVFHFHPIEAKDYNFSLPLLLGDNLVELKVHGRGVSEKNTCTTQEYTMPSYSRTLVDSTVNISIDEIVIRDLPLWSSTERMIFIRNSSKDKTFSYKWEPCSIEGSIKVEVNEKEGLLPPKAFHPIIVKVISMGEPYVTHLVLACRLLDHTQQMLHEQSKENYEGNTEKVMFHFTITEKETIYPSIEKKIEPAPSYFFITLGIDIEIIDTIECLVHRGMESLSKNEPHIVMKVNDERIMKEYIERLSKTNPPLNRSSTEMYDKLRSHSRYLHKLASADECIAKMTEEDVEVISDTMRKLIGQVVYSETFRDIVQAEENDFSTYYFQYQADRENKKTQGDEPSKSTKLSKNKEKETRDFLNQPKPGELAGIMKDLLNETLDISFGRRRSSTSSEFPI